MRSGECVAGRYRLDSPLGRGGMGEVWRCHDLELGRNVAVKMLRESDADDETLRRFRREAAIGAQLQHPGITVVHDIGRHENRLFIVMELLVGQDLARVLAGRPRGLRFEQAVDYAEQAAEALSATHAHGVVHRDLKPANLFRLTDGSLKICDFGIASSVQSTPIETRTGWMLGTPTYMAPEQWHGKDIDTPVDMYALGCVLYAMLTGTPPFRAAKDPLAVMQRHLNDTPAPLRSIRAEIPDELEDLVAALLAKDPKARPHALETADRLHEIAYDGPDLYAQLMAELDAPPPLSPGPAPVAISDSPADATPTSPRDPVRRPVAVLNGPSRRSLMLGGAGVLTVATGVGVLGHLIASASSTKPHSAGSEAATSTDPRWHEFTLTGHTDTVNSVAFSPDGKTLASGSNDNYLRLWDLATRKSIAALKPYFGSDVNSVAFSPDGKTLASGDGLHYLRFWNIATRTAADSVFVGATVTNVAYSPDGKTVATGTADGYFLSLTATTFQPIVLWDARTLTRTAVLDQGSNVSAMAFSPDGKTIAAGTESGLVLLWDLATRKKIVRLNGHADTVFSVAFSPDGKTLASSDSDFGAIVLWDVARRTGTTAFAGDRASGSVAFMPDGKTLVNGSGMGFTIWDLATRKQSARLDIYQNVQSLAISHDGKTIAGGCENGTIRVWKYV